MVAFSLRQRLTSGASSATALAAAVAAAGFCAGLAAFVPAAVFERLIVASGLATLIPAAAPPLGETARVLLALALGIAGGVGAWIVAGLTVGGVKPPFVPDDLPLELPILRRADVHPDAPARAPLRAARDLGVPFLEAGVPFAEAQRLPAERDLPRDLDTPLSAFDPDALPAAPAARVPLVAPLVRTPLAQGERLEVFELTAPIAAPRTDATIHALLDRLEAGVGRRARIERGPRDETFGAIRRLAARA